tara:strand:- start:1655 stop:1933 length:279 start_codon:yes stop_codon:yes gene_type:complete
MNMDDLKRLDRIENKIDKLVEVVASLARLEERMDAVVQRVDRHEYRLDDQEQHTESLTEKVSENTSSRNALERFVWLVVAAIASTVAYMFRE